MPVLCSFDNVLQGAYIIGFCFWFFFVLFCFVLFFGGVTKVLIILRQCTKHAAFWFKVLFPKLKVACPLIQKLKKIGTNRFKFLFHFIFNVVQMYSVYKFSVYIFALIGPIQIGSNKMILLPSKFCSYWWCCQSGSVGCCRQGQTKEEVRRSQTWEHKRRGTRTAMSRCWILRCL